MSQEWSGVVNTTITKYMKGAADTTIRKRLLLAWLKSKGRITYGASGKDLQWQLEYRQHQMQSYGSGGSIDFAPLDRFVTCSVDYRGYKQSDAMSEKERLMNRGPQALIDRYSRIAKDMEKNMTNQFPAELYVDGYAAGNENRLIGFDSFTGTSTTVAADKIAKPSDTYAGRNTALGDKGGTWTAALSTFPNANVATDWPDGQGTPEYDYFTPKLVNWSSTSWGTGSVLWEDNCERAIRQLVTWNTISGGEQGKPDILVVAPNLWVGYQNHWSAKQRIMVPHKKSQDLGFEDTLNQEGLGVTSDFDVAANCGYAWNFDETELTCLYPQLFVSQGPELDFRSQMYLFLLGFFGNLKFSTPKAMGKTKNYA